MHILSLRDLLSFQENEIEVVVPFFLQIRNYFRFRLIFLIQHAQIKQYNTSEC